MVKHMGEKSADQRLGPILRGGLIAIVFVLGGCGPVLKQATPWPVVQQDEQLAQTSDYRLQRGDELQIQHVIDSDYSALVMVAPDGKITVPGLMAQDNNRGCPADAMQVAAAGQTIPELTRRLDALYRQCAGLTHPDFAVVIRGLGAHQVFVGGEVLRPGYLDMKGGDERLMQVLMSAGWLLPTARQDEIIILREGVDGKPLIFALNFDTLISGEDESQNILVRPRDAVLVPKSNVAQLDTWVSQYIRQLLPLPTSASIDVITTGTGVTP
jgi:protein involved in polysaccharide export with SLBB domain